MARFQEIQSMEEFHAFVLRSMQYKFQHFLFTKILTLRWCKWKCPVQISQAHTCMCTHTHTHTQHLRHCARPQPGFPSFSEIFSTFLVWRSCTQSTLGRVPRKGFCPLPIRFSWGWLPTAVSSKHPHCPCWGCRLPPCSILSTFLLFSDLYHGFQIWESFNYSSKFS